MSGALVLRLLPTPCKRDILGKGAHGMVWRSSLGGMDQAVKLLNAQVKWALRNITWWHVQQEFQEGWPDITPWRQWEGAMATAPLHERRRERQGEAHALREEGTRSPAVGAHAGRAQKQDDAG